MNWLPRKHGTPIDSIAFRSSWTDTGGRTDWLPNTNTGRLARAIVSTQLRTYADKMVVFQIGPRVVANLGFSGFRDSNTKWFGVTKLESASKDVTEIVVKIPVNDSLLNVLCYKTFVSFKKRSGPVGHLPGLVLPTISLKTV